MTPHRASRTPHYTTGREKKNLHTPFLCTFEKQSYVHSKIQVEMDWGGKMASKQWTVEKEIREEEKTHYIMNSSF